MEKRYLIPVLLLSAALSVTGCSKEEETTLKNDVLKKSTGPNVVGNDIQFAYVLAVLGSALESAYVEASVPGADGTGFEPYSYYTDAGGRDVGVKVADDCNTTNGISQAMFTSDTMAATLRYRYVIPEEARGKSLSLTFRGKAKNGENVSYRIKDLPISSVYIKKGLELTSADRCYISIKHMAAYTLEEVRDQNLAGDIDLVYHYKALAGVAYNHAFFAPGAPETYREDAIIPEGSGNISKIEKKVYTYDRHLVIDPSSEVSAGAYSFIDDIDFKTYDPGLALSYVLDFKKGESLWVVSQDGKYKAFIQINSVGANSLTVSMKSYIM